jgi:hypothetical protein
MHPSASKDAIRAEDMRRFRFDEALGLLPKRAERRPEIASKRAIVVPWWFLRSNPSGQHIQLRS